MMKVVVFFIAEPEVQYSYNINGLKLVVPFTLKTLLSYRECGVIDAPVLEKLLFAALHLNKDFLATLILAIYIEHGTAVTLRRTQMLGVEILQITNNLSATKQTVDETYQKFLVYLRASLTIILCVSVTFRKYNVNTNIHKNINHFLTYGMGDC